MTTHQRMTLRKFRPADLPAVQRVLVTTMDVSFAGVYPPSAIAHLRTHAQPEEILADAQAGYTAVLESDGRIIATGTLTDGKVKRVYVDPEHQGCGLGRRIMAHLERRARAEGLKSVFLYSTTVAKAFYESLGYTVGAAKFGTMEDGARLDYFEMTKDLTGAGK